ncbi:hypothetical protein BACCELL_00948 [Bacteroides cellulosilyticus DSM 14838]|uniref:Uncharacterized protein n=1 Tax=Bacteroides cellulosilyticus DSM 14838 TaxID=537012 RepID=E2N9K2_9BACE|nr:hypothetical protein BACCELL_00948 [Bacteroides cellulosilyticus DSM 14838]
MEKVGLSYFWFIRFIYNILFFISQLWLYSPLCGRGVKGEIILANQSAT